MVGAAMERAALLRADEALRAAVEKERMMAIYRYTRLWHGADRVCALFEQEKIPFLPLKGAKMRHLYPVPAMRTSCDVDILVREEDLDRAAALLTDTLGFVRGQKTYHDVAFTEGDAVHVELHYNVTEDLEQVDPLLLRVWDYASPVNGGMEHALSPAFFAFHVVSHACEHFLRGGCGIRPVMDLYLLRRASDYDEEGTHALCEKCGIAPFYKALCLLSDVWFGDGAHTPLTKNMEDFIFRGGAYGTKAAGVAANSVKKGSSRLRYALRRIFPERKKLARIYPVLEKHPVLTPVCYVRRWFRVLRRGNGKNAVRELSYAANMPREVQDAIRDLLHDLSL